MDVVHEAAIKEHVLRTFGANKDRVSSLAHMPMSIKLAKLAARGVDISGVDYTKDTDDTNISDDDWEKIEHLMDTSGLSAYDARRQVLGK